MQRLSRSMAKTRRAPASSSDRVSPARPRPHFDDVMVPEVAGGAGDAGGEVGVEEEMLAERASGAQVMARDDIAEWRQVGRHGAFRPRQRRVAVPSRRLP